MRAITVSVLTVLGLGCASSGANTGGATTSSTATAAAVAPSVSTTPTETISRAALRHAIDSMVAQSQFRNSQFGVLVVDPEKSDTLYSLNAGKLFMPASNMKIVTGATSLALLGPDYTYRTEFSAGGRVAHDTLQGALVVTGRGDPTISDHMRKDAMQPLYDVADSLKAHGVSVIAGGLQAAPDVFPDTTIGWGWSWDDLGEDYGAGVDALYFNEGFGTAIARGKVGARPDSIQTLPARTYPRISIAPAMRGDATDTTSLRLGLDPARTQFISHGKLKSAADTLVYVYPDQREAYLAALHEAIVSRGIVVHGGESAMPPAGAASHATPLFTIHSPPLRAILAALEKPSQNQIAEILYKTLGLEKTGVGSADSGQAVLARQLASWGAQPDGYLVRDGSGLSRYGYLSPETLVRVLDKIRADTAFHVFYDALPIAGVDGSLEHRMRGTPAAGNVHAKTGSVANARSLSGYVTTTDNHLLLFSLLANNWTVKQSAVDSVQNRIAIMLASLKLRDAQ
ncbi:MAG: D-alanyl-D-alanine carboxypeptidase/D-alanyl-D-alanine-endopeptidase [Gemmatimonadota bacterium]|nr:D-alanyl-D-alanine carboxypeptidase/D-alanyl-D-alanine-endopeptidase [Gemmatimonadota bacterium]